MKPITFKITPRVLKFILIALLLMILVGRKQMSQYEWNEIPESETEILIEKINEKSSFPMFKSERSHLTITDLPFYSNFKQIKATTFSTIPTVTMYYLVSGTGEEAEVIKMDGSRETIFENNPKGGIIINAETVIPYATFVLGAVFTDQGSLRLVEEVNDDTFTETPTPQQRKEVTHLIRPAKITPTETGFKLDVIMLYGDSVYRAQLDVKNDGYIEIEDEELLVEGMPIRPIFLE